MMKDQLAKAIDWLIDCKRRHTILANSSGNEPTDAGVSMQQDENIAKKAKKRIKVEFWRQAPI